MPLRSAVASLPLPNLLIAGVRKGGTTSLFHYLAQHPGICPSSVKSINRYTPIVYGEQVTSSLDEYARHFRSWAGQPWRLEASPTYFPGGRPLIDAVSADLPDLRVIIILREPVARLWSGYTYRQSKGLLPSNSNFDEVLDTCLHLYSEEFEPHLRFEAVDGLQEYSVYRTLLTGVYVKYLEPWAAVFGDQLRVVFFEDLVVDPATVVAGLCAWLSLDPNVTDFSFSVRNKTRQPRSMAMARAASRANDRVTPMLRDRPRIKRAVKATYGRLNARDNNNEVFTADARAKAQAFYQPSVEQLATVLTELGVGTLPAWLQPGSRD